MESEIQMYSLLLNPQTTTSYTATANFIFSGMAKTWLRYLAVMGEIVDANVVPTRPNPAPCKVIATLIGNAASDPVVRTIPELQGIGVATTGFFYASSDSAFNGKTPLTTVSYALTVTMQPYPPFDPADFASMSKLVYVSIGFEFDNKRPGSNNPDIISPDVVFYSRQKGVTLQRQ